MIFKKSELKASSDVAVRRVALLVVVCVCECVPVENNKQAEENIKTAKIFPRQDNKNNDVKRKEKTRAMSAQIP